MDKTYEHEDFFREHEKQKSHIMKNPYLYFNFFKRYLNSVECIRKKEK